MPRRLQLDYKMRKFIQISIDEVSLTDECLKQLKKEFSLWHCNDFENFEHFLSVTLDENDGWMQTDGLDTETLISDRIEKTESFDIENKGSKLYITF